MAKGLSSYVLALMTAFNATIDYHTVWFHLALNILINGELILLSNGFSEAKSFHLEGKRFMTWDRKSEMKQHDTLKQDIYGEGHEINNSK